MTRYISDARGETWEYRCVASVLERRRISSAVWSDVTGGDFLHMTPAELRHVADVLDGRQREEGQ